MSSKLKEDAIIFLLDEFFINHGLDDLEKNSLKQDNELESIMQHCSKILNEIYKIKSNIIITEKVNNIKKISSKKSYTYIPHDFKKKIDKNQINKVSITGNNTNFKKIKRHSFGNFDTSIDKNGLKRIDINSLYLKSNNNSNLSRDKSEDIHCCKKNLIINLKQLSPNNIYIKNRLIKSNKSHVNTKDIKKDKEFRFSSRNKSKKKAIKHFSISLID